MGIFAYFSAFKKNQEEMIGLLKEIRNLLKEVRDSSKAAAADLAIIKGELDSSRVVGIDVRPGTPENK